ncbi:MAG: LssY C-terminal domain-containing protein [Rudaea sp.]
MRLTPMHNPLRTLVFAVLLAGANPQPGRGQPADATLAATQRDLLAGAPTRSFTAAGVPGDPLNIAFVGSEEELQRAMAAARWMPADPITFRSSLRITLDSLVRRAYAEAPVSSLYVEGRKQDLAFEQPAASNPSRRHHVRFWRLSHPGASATPTESLWVGAATYDARIGLSRVNRHLTHHIAADIDEERDKLLDDLRTGGGIGIGWIEGFQPEREGRNGGGDAFHTDGRLALVSVLAPVGVPGR